MRSAVRCMSVYSDETRRTLFFMRAYSRLHPADSIHRAMTGMIFDMIELVLTDMKA